MGIAGDLLSLLVSLVQETGVVLGVGAVTITLAAHFLALHSRRDENTHAYVRAAHQARALALILIVISGGAAILIHFAAGTTSILWTPAFVCKWALIALLVSFYFLERTAAGIRQDAVEGFEGANWYALFIIHTMAPVVSWSLMLMVYAGWLLSFGAVWAAFVWFMRHQSTIKPVMPAAKPVPPSAPKPTPTPAPKPATPPSVPKPAPKVEVHPNHTLLPIVAELDLPAPSKAGGPAPKPPAPVPPPKVAPPPPPPKLDPKPQVVMTDLNEGLPGIRVMPQRPEDIERSNRPASVNFTGDN